jgi:hypothetical protein
MNTAPVHTATVDPPAVPPSSFVPVANYAVPTSAVPTASGPVKERNVLAIVALIVAGLGFIFSCIPGALIIGWILLPIGFILAIVALFLKGKGKGLAVTALIISVVGTIVAVVVFFAVVANSFNDAFNPKSTISAPSSSAQPSQSKSAAPSAAVGTRENPAPIGSQIKGTDFTVTINSVNLNGNDAVTSANQFNDPPADGTQYAIVNATITYTGKTSATPAEVQIAYVTAGGNVINSFDKIVIGPDPQISANDLYTGASVTGNVVLQIPVNDNGLIRVSPGIVGDSSDVFVKTS